MSTSYIFLAGALFLFVIAIVILFMGKGKKDDKKVDKEFDENYAVNINEVYLRTGDVRKSWIFLCFLLLEKIVKNEIYKSWESAGIVLADFL